MYSQEAIDSLIGLIGFGPSNITGVTISPANISGTSLRTFASFHRSITVKNIHETVEEIHLETTKFNEYLVQAKMDAVKHSLTSIIDTNPQHQSNVDYSDVILANLAAFECAIGLSLAASMLEMMITSTRMNISEREASLSYSQLKIELDGAKNENGHVLAFGLRSKFNKCVKTATKLFFDNSPTVEGSNTW